MCKIAFQLQGSLSVNGEPVNSDGHHHYVMLEGQLLTSGTNDSALAKSIGLRNIAMATGSEEFLQALSPEEIRQGLMALGIFDEVMYGTPAAAA